MPYCETATAQVVLCKGHERYGVLTLAFVEVRDAKRNGEMERYPLPSKAWIVGCARVVNHFNLGDETKKHQFVGWCINRVLYPIAAPVRPVTNARADGADAGTKDEQGDKRPEDLVDQVLHANMPANARHHLRAVTGAPLARHRSGSCGAEPRKQGA